MTKDTYTINISKLDSKIINKYFFNPKIVRFLNNTSVCCYLNFPHNWSNWSLPKRLHEKDLKITSFNENQIIINW